MAIVDHDKVWLANVGHSWFEDGGSARLILVNDEHVVDHRDQCYGS